jgi:hypothetical protein
MQSPPAALTTSPQNCLLCGSTAQYYYVAGRTRKHFLCSHCTQYQISIVAEKRLMMVPMKSRVSLAEMARSHPQGATLIITESGAQTANEENDDAALAHEYVENSKLPG